MNPKSLSLLLISSLMIFLLSSCTKGGGQYIVHGSVSSIVVTEYNSSGGVVATPLVVLTDRKSEVITASSQAISVEVLPQEKYQKKGRKTYSSRGPRALDKDNITHIWLKTD